MIGLDTTAVIDLFKGVPAVKETLAELDEPVCVTMLTYLELMFGIDVEMQKHVKEMEYYDAFFDTVYVLELDKESCKGASRIHSSLKKKGYSIGQLDCTIAAILFRNGITTILTRNRKHFESIPEMKVISY